MLRLGAGESEEGGRFKDTGWGFDGDGLDGGGEGVTVEVSFKDPFYPQFSSFPLYKYKLNERGRGEVEDGFKNKKMEGKKSECEDGE